MKDYSKKTQIVIKSKFKLCVFIFVVSFICLAIVLSPLFNRGQAMEQIQFKTYFVAEGETLWRIAKRTLPDNTDIRDYIGEIRKANNMINANILAGQKLVIPIR